MSTTTTTPPATIAELRAERDSVLLEWHGMLDWKRTLETLTDRADEALNEYNHRIAWLDGALSMLEEQGDG